MHKIDIPLLTIFLGHLTIHIPVCWPTKHRLMISNHTAVIVGYIPDHFI